MLFQKIEHVFCQCIIKAVAGYQYFVSPLLGSHCRFEPSCSHYAQEAFLTYGSIKGFFLTLRRLLRCHPWGGYGYDPVRKTEQRR